STNQSIVANRCFGGAGEKIVATGSGWLILDNYLAWGGQASRTQILVGDDGAIGQGTGHTIISRNLVFSDQPRSALIRFADVGARCIEGVPNAGNRCECANGYPCSDPNSCGTTARSTCAEQTHGVAQINGNTLIHGGTGVAIDASLGLTPGGHTRI